MFHKTDSCRTSLMPFYDPDMLRVMYDYMELSFIVVLY